MLGGAIYGFKNMMSNQMALELSGHGHGFDPHLFISERMLEQTTSLSTLLPQPVSPQESVALILSFTTITPPAVIAVREQMQGLLDNNKSNVNKEVENQQIIVQSQNKDLKLEDEKKVQKEQKETKEDKNSKAKNKRKSTQQENNQRDLEKEREKEKEKEIEKEKEKEKEMINQKEKENETDKEKKTAIMSEFFGNYIINTDWPDEDSNQFDDLDSYEEKLVVNENKKLQIMKNIHPLHTTILLPACSGIRIKQPNIGSESG
ncbi:MAG: hypothetical protein EZS28_052883, partial [Streblomastix strix]